MNITTAIKAPPIATAMATAMATAIETKAVQFAGCEQIIHEIDKMSKCSNMSVRVCVSTQKPISGTHLSLDKQIVHTPTHQRTKHIQFGLRSYHSFSSCSFARQYEFFFSRSLRVFLFAFIYNRRTRSLEFTFTVCLFLGQRTFSVMCGRVCCLCFLFA